MKLQEHHNEFAVKCYAKYMKTNDVVKLFIEEFMTELPQPSQQPELRDNEEERDSIDYQRKKDEYIAAKLVVMEQQYISTYGNKAQVKLEEDKKRIRQELEKEYDQNRMDEQEEKYYDRLYKHKSEIKDFYKNLSSELANQLRRLNITHTQFPEKYRKLFNDTRAEFFKCQRNENLSNNENIMNELETIYGYVKNLIFQEEMPKEAIKQVGMAHNLLKTIAEQLQIDAQIQEKNMDTQKSDTTENS